MNYDNPNQLFLKNILYIFHHNMIVLLNLLFFIICVVFGQRIICNNTREFDYTKYDFENVEEIFINNCGFQDVYALQIANQTNQLPNLVNLTLNKNIITANTLKILFNIRMPRLRLLNLAQNIYLSDDAIQTLRINALENITCLNLSFTNMTVNVFRYLNLKWINNLEQLYISNNDFSNQYPVQLKAPLLKKLYIDYTKIKQFPIKVFSPDIEQLSVVDSQINDSFFQLLRKHQKLDSLKILRLNEIPKFTIQGFKILANISMKSLRQLYLSRTRMDDATLDVLVNHATQIQTLFAAQNGFTEKGLQRYLESHRKIIQLNVNSNYIYTLAGFQYLNKNMTKLLISNNYIEDLYLENIAHLNSLEILEALQNQITDQGLIKLKYVKFPKLKFLSLQSNPLGNRTLSVLATMQLDSLEILDLSLSNLGGSEQNVTLKLPKLKVLQLLNNRLQNVDLKIFSGIESSQLQAIILKDNFINDTGLAYIANMNLEKLTDLFIANTHITGIGFQAFKENSLLSLKILYLMNNNINTQGMNALSRLKLPALIGLFLNNNNLDDESMQIMQSIDLPSLIMIDLQKNFITNQGLTSFGRNSRISLEAISISYNQINQDAIIKFLQNHNKIITLICIKCRVGNPFFSRLPDLFIQRVAILDLSRNFLDDNSMLQLSLNSTDMVNIQVLFLSYNQITDLGMDFFTSMEFLNLRFLDLHGNQISAQKRNFFLQNHRIPNLLQVGIGVNDMDYTKFKQLSKQGFLVG